MNKPKVALTEKLCTDLMDCLFCLSYSVTRDLEGSERYAKSKFVDITSQWEELNGFEFEIITSDEEDE